MKYVYGVASLALVVAFGASMSWVQGVGCGLTFFVVSILAHKLYGLFTGLGAAHTPKMMTLLVPMVIGGIVGGGLLKSIMIMHGMVSVVPHEQVATICGGALGALAVVIDYSFQRFVEG